MFALRSSRGHIGSAYRPLEDNVASIGNVNKESYWVALSITMRC